MGVECGEVPAGARRYPTPEGRELEALRIMTGREAIGLQRGLDRGAAHTTLDARGTAGLVDLNDAVETTQIEADCGLIAIANDRFNTADDRGAAAEGDDGDIRFARPLHHGGHLRLARRNGDEIRRVGKVALKGADSLGIRLSISVQAPLIRISRKHVGNRAGRRYTRRTQADVRQSRWGDESWLDA